MSEFMRNRLMIADPGHREFSADESPNIHSISYWTSFAGQERIESFDGWRDSTNLSTWLAQSRPRLYGSLAGLDNLWGVKNQGVAAFVQVTELTHGPDSEAARTIAAALDDYARLA